MCIDEEIDKNEIYESCEGDVYGVRSRSVVRDCFKEELIIKLWFKEGFIFEE